MNADGSAWLLRGLLLALLLLLLASGLGEEGGGDEEVLRVSPANAADPARLADGFFSASALLRDSEEPPSAPELSFLSAGAARAPLIVAYPFVPPRLVVPDPAPMRTGRAAAILFRVREGPDDTVLVRLSSGGAVLDSARVVVGGAGWGEGGLRVRPLEEGWQSWTVSAGGESRTAAALVRPAGPPRILVVAGPPTWESRFVVRALEESRARVELVQPLGRGFEVGNLSSPPASAGELAKYDAVVVLAGASLGTAPARALRAYVSREGGGVILAGRARLGEDAPAPATEVRADALDWSLPPELLPLPAADLSTPSVRLGDPPPGATVAARSGAGPLLTLQPLGRGRMVTLGLAETWRWRMERGFGEELAAFWRGLADYAAGGLRSRYLVQTERRIGMVGERVELAVYDLEGGEEPPLLVLERPDGSSHALGLAARAGGVYHAAFVPATPGVYTLRGGDGPALGAFEALAAAGAVPSDGWARLGFLADSSGGRMAPADSAVAVAASLLPPGVERGAFSSRTLSFLFAVLILLAVSEWALRRLWA